MPDDEMNANLHSLNKEPVTGEEPSDTNHYEPAERTHQVWEAKPEPTLESIAVPANVARPQPSTEDEGLQKVTPGILVLQWLTYAFWGWTLFSLAILIAMVIGTLFSDGTDDNSTSWLGGGVAYVLAAVIVLFIISILNDLFYSKVEKNRARSTGANVIMIIHAVLFALFGIGSLISAVFGGVQLLIGESSSVSESLSVMVSGIIIAVLYGVTLLRVLRPLWIKNVVRIYWAIMTITVVVATAMGVTGPAMQSRFQKEDQAIESGLSSISRGVTSYITKNDKLPASLNDLSTLDADTKKLVDAGKVKYTAKERIATTSILDLNKMTNGSVLRQPDVQPPAYHYELCVEYNLDDSNDYSYTDDYSPENLKYDATPRTYGHKAGNVCYDLQTRATY